MLHDMHLMFLNVKAHETIVGVERRKQSALNATQ